MLQGRLSVNFGFVEQPSAALVQFGDLSYHDSDDDDDGHVKVRIAISCDYTFCFAYACRTGRLRRHFFKITSDRHRHHFFRLTHYPPRAVRDFGSDTSPHACRMLLSRWRSGMRVGTSVPLAPIPCGTHPMQERPFPSLATRLLLIQALQPCIWSRKQIP